MEKFTPYEQQPKNTENSSEHYLSKEEILKVLSRYGEGEVTRELSSTEGIYLLEVSIDGPGEGETTEIEYRKKGEYPNIKNNPETSISATYYQDGMPVGGDTLATYNEETKEWIHNDIEEINKINETVYAALGKEEFELLAEKGRENVITAYNRIIEKSK